MRNGTWSALGESNRRAVLTLLRDGPRDVSELMQALHLSQPATSKHLRVLREAGLVRVSAAAQRRIYAIEPEPLAELDAWLPPFRQMWNNSLDALGHHLDDTDAMEDT